MGRTTRERSQTADGRPFSAARSAQDAEKKNIRPLPRTCAGRGTVPVLLTTDGFLSLFSLPFTLSCNSGHICGRGEMETAARLPAAIDSFAAAVAAIPAPLVTINSTLLNALLSTVASDLAPALPTRAQAQQEALLTNSTFLAEQFASLSSFLGGEAHVDLSTVSHEEAIAMVEIAATRYGIMTVWAPECWVLVALFVTAALLKLALVGMLTPQAIARVARAGAATPPSISLEKPSSEARELARMRLQKAARAAYVPLPNSGHAPHRLTR
jgi:hypothetical protein